MQGGIGQHLPDGVDARADLVGRCIGGEFVKARAVIQCHGRRDLPLVLQVDAFDPLGLGAVIDDDDGRVVDLIAGIVQGDHAGAGKALGMIALDENTAAQRVLIIEPICRVRLQRIRHILLVGVLRDAVEEDVAEKIRHEIQARIARGDRSLHVQSTLRVLPAQNGKVIQFALVFVECIARVGRLSVDRERRAVGVGDARHLTSAIRNLEFTRRTRQHCT